MDSRSLASADNRGPEPLVSRLAALDERHLRLLALELAAIVDELQSVRPEAGADPVFCQAWNQFASLRGGLRQALAEPALEAWIGQTKALIGSPALRTCPGHHVARTLARFTALMINLAGYGEELAEGRAALLGGGSVPLLLGSAQLRPPTVRRIMVAWFWRGGLRLQDEDGRALMEISPEGPRSAADGWPLDVAQDLDGIRVFAAPRCAQHAGAPAVPSFPAAFARAYAALPRAAQLLLRCSTRAAGPRCDAHGLQARSWLGLSASPSAEELAEGLAANLVDRCARVYRFDTSSRLSDALGAPAQEELVQTVARELLRDEAGAPGSMLLRILAICEAQEPVSSRGSDRLEQGSVLDFRPVLAQAGIEVADAGLWTEPKSHRQDKSPGWRIVDGLLSLSRDQLARLRSALSGWPEPEVRHFGVACVDYYEGHFLAAIAHVLTCLQLDPTCEEYWLLLALLSRHLRHYEIFDDIAFGQSRSTAVLERVRRAL